MAPTIRLADTMCRRSAPEDEITYCGNAERLLNLKHMSVAI
jgi:hypothetical protein